MPSGTANRKIYPVIWYKLVTVDDMTKLLSDLLNLNLGWGGDIHANRAIGQALSVTLELRGPAPVSQREVVTFGQFVIWDNARKLLSVELTQAAFDAKYTVT